jgi:type I restriction enzyme S subunit
LSVPQGWVGTTLGDVTEIVSGSTPRTNEPSYWDGEIPWITPDDLSRDRSKLVSRGARSITQIGYASCSTRLVPAGTVLYSSRAPIGYAAIAANPLCTNQGFKSLVPSAALTSDYLYWFLIFATPQIKKLGSGTTFPELSRTKAREIPIPVPPLAEQRRIVAAIEEQLSRLDAAVELLRQSEQRARVLLDAQIRTRIDETDWRLVPLSQTAELITDGDHNPPPRVASGVPHLTAKNIRSGEIRIEGCTFVSLEGFEQTRKRYDPKPGDVIVTCVGTIGESAVVPEGIVFSADRNLAAVRPTPDFDANYLRFALSSRRQRQAMLEASGSTAQPHLYLRDLRALQVPAPPLEQQRAITSTLAAEVARVGQLGGAVGVARRRAEALRRSVLASAFRGELVAQDPHDEPASAMLGRIAAERAAAPKPARKRREKASI